MKKITWLFVFISISNFLLAQNVGIGTTNPLIKLHIKGGLLLDSTNGVTPVSGAGTRLMWIPAKEAFRAGRVTGDDWNADSIGIGSVAFGLDTKGKGTSSTAMGNNTTASGAYSFAVGQDNVASGLRSIAVGSSNTASGSSSMAAGLNTVASGSLSTATGYLNKASGSLSNVSGHWNTSKSYAGTVIGLYNDSTNAADRLNPNPLNRLFQIGNGTYDDARRNAMTVLQNGNTGLGTTTPQSLLHTYNGSVLFEGTNGSTPLSGGGTRLMWIPAKEAFRAGHVGGVNWDNDSIGMGSIAMGWDVKAKGEYSFSFGTGSFANGDYATALGVVTQAKGFTSTSMGSYTIAGGDYSTAMGALSSATGQYSTAIGYNTKAIGNYSITLGYEAEAKGLHAISIGSRTKATGWNSFAAGDLSEANGIGSISMGFRTKAIGNYALATGIYTSSKSYGGTVIGMYNDSTNAANSSGNNVLNRIFQIGNGTADDARSNAMTVLQNGNVGIGTVNPNFPLHVSSTNQVVVAFNGGPNMYMVFGESGIARGYLGSYAGDAEDVDFGTIFGNPGKVHLTTSNAPRLTVGATGNIGIAQVNPAVPLNFADVTGNKISLWGNSASSNYGLGIQPNLLQMYSNSFSTDIAFGYGSSTSFTERMRIKGNGKVGIGIINPGEIFEVADRMLLHSGPSGSAGIWLNKLDNTAAAGFIGTYSNDYIGLYGNNAAGWGILMNTANGNVGIGTATPSEKLHVNGNICYTGSIAACSDIRYKKNIQPLNNSLSKILLLHGISYNWNKEKFKDKAFTNETQIGFSAQEIEKLFPELVQTDVNGYKAVDYSRLTPVLVEAVKEQQKQIDDQAKKIEWLMKEMQVLKEKIEK